MKRMNIKEGLKIIAEKFKIASKMIGRGGQKERWFLRRSENRLLRVKTRAKNPTQKGDSKGAFGSGCKGPFDSSKPLSPQEMKKKRQEAIASGLITITKKKTRI